MAGNKDHLLVDKTKERPSFRCWRPNSASSLQAENAFGYNAYEEFNEIVRTVHLDECGEIHRSQQLKASPSTETTGTYLLHTFPDMKGLWFGISDLNFEDDLNWHGDVSYKVDLESFLESLKIYNTYLVEVVEFPTTSTSRLLITTQRLDLPQYDPTVKGGPWYKDPSGRNWFLNDARRYDGVTNVFGHQVQFILIIPDCEAASLPDMLRIAPVNNSQTDCASEH
ncbi:uncharacterized protein [Panulirus ornatus]|uniref:uncharacterized protein n=1 Tax=Panulirus ornatus TaxID=150431 RepID=UPI003A8BA589